MRIFIVSPMLYFCVFTLSQRDCKYAISISLSGRYVPRASPPRRSSPIATRFKKTTFFSTASNMRRISLFLPSKMMTSRRVNTPFMSSEHSIASLRGHPWIYHRFFASLTFSMPVTLTLLLPYFTPSTVTPLRSAARSLSSIVPSILTI